jgi:hypothetical protein
VTVTQRCNRRFRPSPNGASALAGASSLVKCDSDSVTILITNGVLIGAGTVLDFHPGY